MTARLLRAALFAIVTIAAWTVARPAMAMAVPAPYCDDRGASAIAAPPTLEAPDVGVRRAPPVRCAADERNPGATASRGRAPAPAAHSPIEPGVPSRPPASLSMPAQPVLAPAAQSTSGPRGQRARVERPPRG